jgi:excisionase family DNA binding protein
MATGMGAGGEGASAAAAPAQMAVGFAMAQEMMRGMQAPGPTPPPGATVPDVLTPEQAAQLLAVSAEDVIAAIEAGELKGRRIGTAYRIARVALDDYLRGG